METIINLWNKIKAGLLIAVSAIVAIFAALFVYEKKKEEVQQALKDNAQTEGKVEAINNQITDVQNKEKEEENAPMSKQDYLDFLNNKSDDSK